MTTAPGGKGKKRARTSTPSGGRHGAMDSYLAKRRSVCLYGCLA